MDLGRHNCDYFGQTVFIVKFRQFADVLCQVAERVLMTLAYSGGSDFFRQETWIIVLARTCWVTDCKFYSIVRMNAR
jgi:hypothetical protein